MPLTHLHQKQKPDSRIESEADYEESIKKIEELWDFPDGTPQAQARAFLVKMVEEYESRNESLE